MNRFKYLVFATLLYPSIALTSCYKEASSENKFALGKKYQLEEIFDITYYEGEEKDAQYHKLNLFLPKNIENPPPVMIWIHGGAWAFGGRKYETDLARKFAREGIAVAVVSYRLSPGTWKDPKWSTGVQHPEHIKDIARAFAWVHDHAAKYNYDKHSVFVSGYSAGGHLSALLALDPTYLEAVGKSVRDIKGAIPIAGAYDIEAYYNSHLKYNGLDMAEKHVMAVFGNSMTDLKRASPTEYVNNQWVPMLVMSDSETFDYTRLFEESAKDTDYRTMNFYHVKDKTHAELFEDLSRTENSKYREMIVEFINENKADYKFLQKEDIKLAYNIVGSGDPVFLLNGGPGFSSHNFISLANKLSDHNQIIIFDQRGTGYSSLEVLDGSTITLDLMIEDLEALRTHLGFDKISIIGHSFGGIYGMAYAARYPDRIEKMVLSHSGGMNLDFLKDVDTRMMSRLNDQERAIIDSLPNISNPDLRSMYLTKSIAAGYLYDRNLKDIVFRGLAFNSRYSQNVNSLVWRDMRKINYDVSAEMSAFMKPVLIILGDNDVINPDVAEYSHSILPNSDLVFLKNCGHYGWLDQPESYMTQLRTFLSK